MDGGELCSARCAEQPFDVGFHPNSQIFVAGLITGEVEIWERDAARDAARKLKTVRCHDAACRTLAFVNDGALLLTGSSDRSILATDVATSKPLARLTNAHKAAVNRIVSIDAHTIASKGMTTASSRCGTPGDKRVAVSSRRSSTSSPTWRTCPWAQAPARPRPVRPPSTPPRPGRPPRARGGGRGRRDAARWSPPPATAPSGCDHLCLRSWTTLGQSDTLDDELLSVCVMKRGRKTLAGSQTGVLNVFDYGKWEEPSDRFPGTRYKLPSAIVKIDEDTVLTGSATGSLASSSVGRTRCSGWWASTGTCPWSAWH